MNPDLDRAIRELLEAWETPDSPESLAFAIYQLKRIHRANSNKPKVGRPRKAKA